MPQLRILVTDFCDSKCIYCRPSGEGNLKCTTNRILTLDIAKMVAKVYKDSGGTEIKISGGDPAYWPYLVDFVYYLKKNLLLEKVEVITRSTKIEEIVDELISAGLDVLNFSLDTINKEKYEYVTGKRDFVSYLNTIESCSKKVFCKINTVVMHGINDDEWRNLIEFCEKNRIRQLKLLDYIDDLSGNLNEGDSRQKYFLPLDSICTWLRKLYGSERIIYQGGLGHPMNSFTTNQGVEIICKNSKNGAWYSDECEFCSNYPCHDALMAVRVSTANSFQLCLLNPDKHWYFNEKNMDEQFQKILKVYQNAHFIGE